MYGNKDPDSNFSLLSSTGKKFEKIQIPLSNVKKSDSHVRRIYDKKSLDYLFYILKLSKTIYFASFNHIYPFSEVIRVQTRRKDEVLIRTCSNSRVKLF